MKDEQYRMEYPPEFSTFLFSRRASRQAAFFLPYLRSGMMLLDAGCGPGSITVDLAEIVAPAQVFGVDINEKHIKLATQYAQWRKVKNAYFKPGDITQLAFPDESFDAVFVHGVLEYLNAERAFSEIYRVLKSGGMVGARHGDFGGFLIYPEHPEIIASFEAMSKFLTLTGGDPHCGRNQFAAMRKVGFINLKVSASYDCWTETREAAREAAEMMINVGRDMAEAGNALGLAGQSGPEETTSVIRAWGEDENAFAAEAWGEAVAWKP